jgi:hypothetical protein
MSKLKYHRWSEVIANLKEQAQPAHVDEHEVAARIALGLCPIHGEPLQATFCYQAPGFDTLRCTHSGCTVQLWAGLKSSAYRNAQH